MKIGKWTTLLDDTDFLEIRLVSPRCFQVIEITDMDDACGRDNEGRPTFVAELALVDLNAATPANVKSALESCGWEGMPSDNPIALAECLYRYGYRAPLDSHEGNGRTTVHRAARASARALLDSDSLADAMDRPVNALGSTAAEYMRGDFNSAMARGVHAGSPAARIMAKMHGIDQHVIDDARPADFLPYLMGYMAGKSGAEREVSDPDDPISPEYFQGYDRGARVRAGECPAPSWIK